MAKIPELDRPGTLLPWWMTAIVTGQTTNARLPLSHLGGLPRGAIALSLANYLADTAATADADPGAGNLRWNHATQASASEVYLSDVDGDAADHGASWPTLAAGGHLYLYNPADLDVWQWWTISAVTDASGYAKLGISLTDSAGSFDDDDPVVVTIQQPDPAVGDAEDVAYDNSSSGLAATTVQDALDELAGGGGSGGASIGVQYLADTASTSDADPGAGNLRWNHATQSSATQLFLDDSTVDGANMTGFWSALDAGGFAYLQHTQDQDVWQIWELTSVTDATGYVKFGAALLASGGVFADDDPMLVTLQQGPGGGGGGLTNFTEGLNNSSPNATVPYAYLLATGAATSIDVAICAKGSGAFSLSIADGTMSGGNKRGMNAVDLQTVRGANTQVASGNRSFVAGWNNTASAQGAVAMGGNGVASGDGSVAMGNNCTASGTSSVAMGQQAAASGNYSVALGGGTANAVDSVALGRGAAVNSVVGAHAEAVSGGPQRTRYTLQGQTSNATPLVLTTDAGGAAATNQVYFGNPNNRSGIYRGLVVARQPGNGGGKKTWEFVAHLDRDAGTLALVAAVTPTVVADSGVPWSISVTADNTLKTLKVEVTGAASTTVRWACYIHGQEVNGS